MSSKSKKVWFIDHQNMRRGFRTKKEAENALMDMEISLMKGTLIKASRMSFKAFLFEKYLKYNMTRVKIRNLEIYTQLIEKYINPYIGHLDLSKLTHKGIKQFYKQILKSKQITDQNLGKLHKLINHSLETAVRWSLLSKNPAALVDRPNIKEENNVLNSNQLEFLLKATEGFSRYCIFYNIGLISNRQK